MARLPPLPSLDDLARGLRSALTPRLEIAVTGLRRAGKTVFVTSAIHNLRSLPRNRAALPALARPGVAEIVAVTPFGDGGGMDGAPVQRGMFPWRRHLRAMVEGSWPVPTAAVAAADLLIRHRRRRLGGFGGRALGALAPGDGLRALHLRFVDYPGEWLLDLDMEDDYDGWATRTLARLRAPPRARLARDYLALVEGIDPAAPAAPDQLETLHAVYAALLRRLRDEAGLVHLQPGRYLMPDPDDPRPVPRFAPIDTAGAIVAGPDSAAARFRAAYGAYRNDFVRPFFESAFAATGAQVVLVDLLGALNAGEAAFADTCRALEAIAAALTRRRRSGSLRRRLFPRRVRRVLFAATKADHVPDIQRDRLAELLEAITGAEADAARAGGAIERAMALAATRCTVDETLRLDIGEVEVVVGVPVGEAVRVKVSPGTIPKRPPGPEFWQGRDVAFPVFKPPALHEVPADGVPHVGLDAALRFLLEDALR